MSSIDYSNLSKSYRLYLPIWIALNEWFERNPKRTFIDGEQAKMVLDAYPLEAVAVAFGILVQNKKLDMSFRVVDPHTSQPLSMDYDAPSQIPKRLRSSNYTDFDTDDAEVVAVYRPARASVS